jgi:hypothetical protein
MDGVFEKFGVYDSEWLDHLFQHRDRVVGRRAVDWGLTGQLSNRP